MNKKRIYLILSIIWMGIIFYMSNQPGNISQNLSQNVEHLLNSTPIVGDIFSNILNSAMSQFILRKMAHFSLYAFLAVLCFILIYEINRNIKKSTLISFIIISIYSCMDEIHQMFIPGRNAQLIDVFIDCIGGVVGLAIINVFFILKSKFKKLSSENN